MIQTQSFVPAGPTHNMQTLAALRSGSADAIAEQAREDAEFRQRLVAMLSDIAGLHAGLLQQAAAVGRLISELQAESP
jgi:hypothetical protein